MIIPSPSSSNSSSAFAIISFTSFLSILLRFKLRVALSSPSNNFTEYHLLNSELDIEATLFSISTNISSRSPSKTLICLCGSLALLIDSSITLSMFLPFRADISTTGQSKLWLSLTMSIESLFFSTISIIFNASIIGIPISDSCVDRYKFLSILEASTTFTITSGFSFSKYSLLTTSSNVYGESE